MHYKTMLVLLIFAITFTLIWLFHILIGYIFPSIVISPYAVVGGLTQTFGPDVAWWATLGLALTTLGVIEISVTTIKQRISGELSAFGSKPNSGEREQLLKTSTRVWMEIEKDSRGERQLQDLYEHEN